MVIQSSRVAMGSARVYSQSRSDSTSLSSFGRNYAATMPEAKESEEITTKQSAYSSEYAMMQVGVYQNYASNGQLLFEGGGEDTMSKSLTDRTYLESTVFSQEKGTQVDQMNVQTEFPDGTDKVQDKGKSTIGQSIMKKTLGLRRKRMVSLRELLELLIQNRRDAIQQLLHLQSGQNGQNGMIERRNVNFVVLQKAYEMHQSTYQESEQTAFSSKGLVVTADGQEIDFNVNLMMSRSFMETTSEEYVSQAIQFTDPLVVNFASSAVEVTDQTFSFDLDADGETENIAILSELCGYLALDRNGDGMVNDGTELFGARTGDGFGELAVFDLDGNGWIDENDEVFDQLRIWSKDADGNDQLVGLGVRGIGAIYLGHALSQFSITNAENETQAVVRSTGVFLKENGEVGTIQQVDMAS